MELGVVSIEIQRYSVYLLCYYNSTTTDTEVGIEIQRYSVYLT
jgi:hypothetical protein